MVTPTHDSWYGFSNTQRSPVFPGGSDMPQTQGDGALFHPIEGEDPEVVALAIEVAVRLYGVKGIRMPPTSDPDLIRRAISVCRRLCVPLVFPPSNGDTCPDSLVLGDGNLRPYPVNPAQVEPGRDVADTIRRLSDHLTPRINDH